MKKTILAAAIALSMISGCSMMGASEQTPDELLVAVQEVSSQEYTASKIAPLEQTRMAVNTLSAEAQPVYADYVNHLNSNDDAKQIQAGLSMQETEEDKAAFWATLSKEEQAAYTDFVNDEYMTAVYKKAAVVGLEIAAQTAAFSQLDTKALMGNLDFSDMGQEASNVDLTVDQLALLNDTIYSLYQEYQYNKAAGFIK
ncbi:hypothetical protein [Moritella dasanensis]|uniref:hypothetical protein n=1 Tax=Moritella dasanensis TaxID=428031 RepID=UPI00031D0F7C|nr:hypothetical protein [Moritella dasanensis]